MFIIITSCHFVVVSYQVHPGASLRGKILAESDREKDKCFSFVYKNDTLLTCCRSQHKIKCFTLKQIQIDMISEIKVTNHIYQCIQSHVSDSC